jgi:hypothetical protein
MAASTGVPNSPVQRSVPEHLEVLRRVPVSALPSSKVWAKLTALDRGLRDAVDRGRCLEAERLVDHNRTMSIACGTSWVLRRTPSSPLASA